MRMAKPIFPWMGNKVKLLPFIQKMIPPNVKQYLEPFGGSGAVVLGLKPKKNRLDIYNDLNNDLFNVFCCIKERPLAFCRELGLLPVHGRIPFAFYRDLVAHKADFYKHIEQEKALLQEYSCFTEFDAEEIRKILDGKANLFDVERAKAFLLVSHGSFSGTMTSVGVKTIDTKPILEELPKVIKRISTVFLENQDAFELIQKRDRSDGVIYADPPYFQAEGCYAVDFPLENHLLLRNLLRGCKGYVILSYNKCQQILDLYKDDFFIFSLIRNNPLAQSEGSTYGELLITNFDPRPLMDTQMDLFAPSADSKWELILLNVPTHILKT